MVSIWQWCKHDCTVFTEEDSTPAVKMDPSGDADSDREDISAPVKRRRKMVLIDEEEDED